MQTLIAGGSDTTIVFLTWVFSLLLNNRDTLKKAIKKKDIQVGKERLVNEQDIRKLVYLQAILKENEKIRLILKDKNTQEGGELSF